MTNELLRPVERRIIKKYIGSFFDLLAELVEAFYNNRHIYFTFHYARIQIIMPIQKTQDIETTAMCGCWNFND